MTYLRQRSHTPSQADSSAETTPRSSPPVRRLPFKLKSDERWAIVGKTGSGKSIFARYLDRQWMGKGWPIFIVDVKHRYIQPKKGQHYADQPTSASVESPYPVGQFTEGVPVQIYLPDMPAIHDDWLNRQFFRILERGGVVVHIEDTYGLCAANSMPDGLGALWTQGRAADVPMIVCSQRPFQVPQFLLSQSENFCVFKLKDERDRVRMAQVMGDPAVMQQLPKYHYWYYHEEMEHPVKMAPLPEREVRE